MSWDIRTRIKIVFNTITKKPSSDWEEIILQVLSIDDEATDRALNVCCKVIGYATNGESLFPPLVYYCYNFFIVIILYASTRFLFISITLFLLLSLSVCLDEFEAASFEATHIRNYHQAADSRCGSEWNSSLSWEFEVASWQLAVLNVLISRQPQIHLETAQREALRST